MFGRTDAEEDYIDALILAPRLDYVKRWAPEDWPLAFFDSLHLLPQRDFRLIEQEMRRNLSKHSRRNRGYPNDQPDDISIPTRQNRRYPNGQPDDISRREEELEESMNGIGDEEYQPLLDSVELEDEDENRADEIESDDGNEIDPEPSDQVEQPPV